MSNNITDIHDVNPLLYELPRPELILQPYWIFVIQLLVVQIIQRIWNLVRYRTYKTGLEMALYDDDSERMEFDIIDFLLLVPPFAHFIWYVIQQPRCISYPSASIWKCYNIFGYKMANFVISQCCNSFFNVSWKLHRTYNDDSKWGKSLKYLILIMNTMLMTVSVPYLCTNILPMCGAYIWILILYLMVVGTCGVLLIFLCLEENLRARFVAGFIVTGIFSFGFYVIAPMYNYSQYLYFGNNYIHTVVVEYQSHKTTEYYEDIKSLTEAVGHLILSPILNIIFLPFFIFKCRG